MKWIVVGPHGKFYGPFDDQDQAYSWCYKKWPNPSNKLDPRIKLKVLMPTEHP